MAQQELKIIQDFYDFMLWMIKHVEKFPRHHRYSLGVDSTMKDLKNMKKGQIIAKQKVNHKQKTMLNLRAKKLERRYRAIRML